MQSAFFITYLLSLRWETDNIDKRITLKASSQQMHNDAGSCVLAVVDALVGFHKIYGQSGRDIFKALRIQVGEWKPRAGQLHHDPVAT
jgi:hypothetical protein